jgi:hypothetical protein
VAYLKVILRHSPRESTESNEEPQLGSTVGSQAEIRSV